MKYDRKFQQAVTEVLDALWSEEKKSLLPMASVLEWTIEVLTYQRFEFIYLPMILIWHYWTDTDISMEFEDFQVSILW